MAWPARTYRFRVPFVAGKQRPRFVGRRAYTPQKTKDAESAIANAYRRLANGVPPAPSWVPVHVRVCVMRRLQKKAPRRLVARLDLGKPDVDNVVKLVLDALNGVAYEDDRQVERVEVWREWRTRKETDEMEVAVTFPKTWDPSWNDRFEGES